MHHKVLLDTHLNECQLKKASVNTPMLQKILAFFSICDTLKTSDVIL